MNVINLLKDRRRHRVADTRGRYWSRLAELAAGGLTDRELAKAVEALDDDARELGREENAVEADLARMQELRQLDGAAVAKRRGEMSSRFATADARIRQAELAVERAAGELEAARAARQPIEGDALALTTASNRVESLRRVLAESGCPDDLLATLAPKGTR